MTFTYKFLTFEMNNLTQVVDKYLKSKTQVLIHSHERFFTEIINGKELEFYKYSIIADIFDIEQSQVVEIIKLMKTQSKTFSQAFIQVTNF